MNGMKTNPNKYHLIAKKVKEDCQTTVGGKPVTKTKCEKC